MIFLKIRTTTTAIKNKLHSNGIPVSYKINTGVQYNVTSLTILQNSDPEPDICPMNIKLSTYNHSKIPVLRKCSITIKLKKDQFDVSFIIVDSKPAPILGLATSERLSLINVFLP